MTRINFQRSYKLNLNIRSLFELAFKWIIEKRQLILIIIVTSYRETKKKKKKKKKELSVEVFLWLACCVC